ncbi:MAG: hypothetical protein ACI843_000508 [Psychrobacter glaciei]|jgi:hypothetical protein
MNSVFRLTILTSLLLHLTVYVAVMVNFEDILVTEPEVDKTMEFVLEPPAPAPAPEPIAMQPNEEQQADTPPPSRHMEDDINKANLSDGLAELGGKQTPKPKGQENTEINDSQPMSKANRPELISNTLSSLLQQAVDNVKLETADNSEDNDTLGQQLDQPDDEAQDNNLVESPLDKLEEEKARWRNMVLKTISEQINFVWVKPENSSELSSGVIRLDLDAEGYLKAAWVDISSGDRALDASILRAIRSIWRFQIPESDRLNRHYGQLGFNFRGGK